MESTVDRIGYQTCTALMTQPVQASFRNLRFRGKKKSVDNSHTLLRPLPVCCNEEELECKGSEGEDKMLLYRC